jgi:hypothetical protein
MSEFKHLMKVFGGPMGGVSCVMVKPAEAYYGNNALTIKYNNQTLTVGLDELEETIAAVRKYYKDKLE